MRGEQPAGVPGTLGVHSAGLVQARCGAACSISTPIWLMSSSRRLGARLGCRDSAHVAVERGGWSWCEWFTRVSSGPGLLVLEGLLALNVRVADRVSAELLGPGELLQPPDSQIDQLVSYELGWRALSPVRFALLDGSFANRVRFWPELAQALLRRSGRRIVSLEVQRAIAAQPRLEARLAVLLWHLAGRWGRVQPDGIRLPLPVTHPLLGQLIGAQRPSVSKALARLGLDRPAAPRSIRRARPENPQRPQTSESGPEPCWCAVGGCSSVADTLNPGCPVRGRERSPVPTVATMTTRDGGAPSCSWTRALAVRRAEQIDASDPDARGARSR